MNSFFVMMLAARRWWSSSALMLDVAATRLRADDALFDGLGDGACVGVDVEFGVDVREVALDGGFADEELFGDVTRSSRRSGGANGLRA